MFETALTHQDIAFETALTHQVIVFETALTPGDSV